MPRPDLNLSLRTQATAVEDARERKTTHHLMGVVKKKDSIDGINVARIRHQKPWLKVCLRPILVDDKDTDSGPVIFSKAGPGYEIILFVQGF